MSERQRSRRQPALRMFALEYYEASLVEQGSGQYDPSFVITKLGARVNRMCVAGLLERMERRESESGTMYHGSLRDPTGLHMFSVGSFQPELHADMEELLSRHEENEPLLLLAVGKANAQMTDDGGVFTRVRLEEFNIIDGEAYANWLVDAAEMRTEPPRFRPTSPTVFCSPARTMGRPTRMSTWWACSGRSTVLKGTSAR